MSTDYYEQSSILSEYLLFHYGSTKEILPDFSGAGCPDAEALHYPIRCVRETFYLPKEGGRALDLGCAVGASTFELARHYRQVVGIDFSQRFIEVANTLKEEGSIDYQRKDEGKRTTRLKAEVATEIDRSRVQFLRGDAMDLPQNLGTFDAVLMANLIDRLPDPKRCLDQLPDLIQRGGQLVITSPYTWLEQFTPEANWLCGEEGTLAGLTKCLAEHFTLESVVELPFLIREHARKFQWSVAQASQWIRK